MKEESPLEAEAKGIGYMILSASSGGFIAALVKSLSAGFSPIWVFWFSRLFTMIGLIPLAFHLKLKDIKSERLGYHLFLNCLYVTGIFCNFYALAYIPLIDASLLFNTAPLYAPLIAAVFIDEHFPKELWLYILISFIGVLFVLQPGAELFNPISLVGAASGLIIAGAQVVNRHLSPKEGAIKVLFYMIVMSPILSSILVLFFPKSFSVLNTLGTEPPVFWMKMVLTGVFVWFFQLTRAKSVEHGRASVVMPFTFIGVLVAGLLDWIFWNEAPNKLSLLGMALIFFGIFFLFKRSGRNRR